MVWSLDSRVLDHWKESEALVFQEKVPALCVILMGNFGSDGNEEDLIIHLNFQLFREHHDIIRVYHAIFKKFNNWIFSGVKMISMRTECFGFFFRPF